MTVPAQFDCQNHYERDGTASVQYPSAAFPLNHRSRPSVPLSLCSLHAHLAPPRSHEYRTASTSPVLEEAHSALQNAPCINQGERSAGRPASWYVHSLTPTPCLRACNLSFISNAILPSLSSLPLHNINSVSVSSQRNYSPEVTSRHAHMAREIYWSRPRGPRFESNRDTFFVFFLFSGCSLVHIRLLHYFLARAW